VFQTPSKLNCTETVFREGIATLGRRLIPGRAGVTTDGLLNNRYRQRCMRRGRCGRGCDLNASFHSPAALIAPARDTGHMTLRPYSVVREVLLDEATNKARGVRVIDALTRDVMDFTARVVVLGAGTLAAPVGAQPPGCTEVGTPGRDVMEGGPGDDVLCGLGGNDELIGKRGDDILYGGDGRDLLDGGHGNDVLVGGANNDHGFGGNGNDRFLGGKGNDYGYGGPGADRQLGGPGSDFLYGWSGHGDLVKGGSGNDWCLSTWDSDGDDTVIGGPGTDNYFVDEGDRRFGVEKVLVCVGD